METSRACVRKCERGYSAVRFTAFSRTFRRSYQASSRRIRVPSLSRFCHAGWKQAKINYDRTRRLLSCPEVMVYAMRLGLHAETSLPRHNRRVSSTSRFSVSNHHVASPVSSVYEVSAKIIAEVPLPQTCALRLRSVLYVPGEQS